MVSCHMLPMMASLCIFAISTVCRWGTEQPQSSFGVIFISFPMKIAGSHPHGSQGKSCILCVYKGTKYMSVADLREGAWAPLIFRSNWRPKGQKKWFLWPDPLISGSGWSPPPTRTTRRSRSATECNAFSTELPKNSAYPRDEAPYYRWYGFSHAFFSKWSLLRP